MELERADYQASAMIAIVFGFTAFLVGSILAGAVGIPAGLLVGFTAYFYDIETTKKKRRDW